MECDGGRRRTGGGGRCLEIPGERRRERISPRRDQTPERPPDHVRLTPPTSPLRSSHLFFAESQEGVQRFRRTERVKHLYGLCSVLKH